jgi:hypothetical protein
MKKTPQDKEFEALLRASNISGCGFLGTDTRDLWEIIQEDSADVRALGQSTDAIAARLRELTAVGQKGLGEWVPAGKRLQVQCDDSRGVIPCPWPHHVRCLKRTTTIRTDAGDVLRWSDLNVHLIEAHGFFEGRGSPFRLEPKKIIAVLFRDE